MNLRSNLNKAAAPPARQRRPTSGGRGNLLASLEEAERLAKAGESSFRAASARGLLFDHRASKRAHVVYDNHAASRAGVTLGDPEASFSILSFHPFTQRSLTYPTVHHYVMAERFAGSPIAAEIPQAASLWELDRLVGIGEANKWERPDWQQVRLNTLIMGNYLKFRQNHDIMRTLIRTKQRTIVTDPLPAHYRDWVAHEKVVKKNPTADEDDAANNNNNIASSDAGASGSRLLPFLPPLIAAAAASTRSVTSYLLNDKEKEEPTTITLGSTCKNLGGAVLMSLRKKLAIAFQADEKQRIKERQMQILKQQMEEKAARDKKKEEERLKKEEERTAAAAAATRSGRAARR